MKIVIDLDEEYYADIKKWLTDNDGCYSLDSYKLRDIIRKGKPCREFGSLPYDDDKTTCMVCPICGSVWEVENEDSNI